MSEMVERIARAIAVARGMVPDAKSATAFEGAPRDCKVWETLVPSARAAIEAMREPTEDMLWAAHGQVEAEANWRAMIDKALEENPQ